MCDVCLERGGKSANLPNIVPEGQMVDYARHWCVGEVGGAVEGTRLPPDPDKEQMCWIPPVPSKKHAGSGVAMIIL